MGQKDNHVMEKEQRREAKQHLVVLMHQGISWKEARATVGVHISRSTAYRWVQGVQSRGEAALLDRRHGHPTKLREAVLQWLVATCRANPQMPSREVQAALQEQFDIYVSIGHLNRVRGQLGIENHRGRSKKNSKRSLLPPLPQWQEGAGALLLVAAANTSGLLEALETALSCCAPQAGSRLAHLSTSSRQSLLQTLLFLGVVGLSRPWGLRGYTGDALGRLPGRSRAYGYFHTERFLAELARSNGAEAFTSALARWTTRLWQSEVSAGMNVSALFYIDGQTPPGLHRCPDSSWSGWATLNNLRKPNACLAS